MISLTKYKNNFTSFRIQNFLISFWMIIYIGIIKTNFISSNNSSLSKNLSTEYFETIFKI